MNYYGSVSSCCSCINIPDLPLYPGFSRSLGIFFCRLTPKFNQSISISSTSTHQENTNDKKFLRERSKYPSDFFWFSLHQSSLKAGKVLFYYYSHLALRHVCHISLIILNLSSIIIDLSIVFSKHSHSVF